MDFEFTEEQKLLRDTLKKMSEQEIEPLMASYPEDKALPKEACLKIYKMVQPLGLLGCRVPLEDGGTGVGPFGTAITYEILPFDIANCISATEIAATRICLGGSKDLIKRIVPPLVSAKKVGCTGTSEPGVGSDPRGVETKAVPDGDFYIINGTKIWASNANIADTMLVTCSMGRDEMGHNILTQFVLEREVSPFEAWVVPTMALMQGHLAEAVLKDCRVPKENILSEAKGHGHRILTQTWLSQRPSIGLGSVRVADKALEASIKYAKERVQFGKPIGAFQLVQAMIVEMASLVDASRLLCWRAINLLEKGVWAARESSMAKFFAAESSLKVTSLAVEIHGTYGITKEYPVEKYFRDARAIAFPDGTIEIQKLIVGREILGIRAFY